MLDLPSILNFSLMNIVWLTNNLDFDDTSNRLRCFHFARYFHANYDLHPVITSRVKTASQSITSDSILIVNNILNSSILHLLYKAKFLKIPLVIDLQTIPQCDGLFDHILDIVDLLVVPTWRLKDALASAYPALNDKISFKIRVVPDFAEDQLSLKESRDFLVSNKLVSSSIPPSVDRAYSHFLTENPPISESTLTVKTNSIVLLDYSYSLSKSFSLLPYRSVLRALKPFQDKYNFSLIVFDCQSKDLSILDEAGLKYSLVEFNVSNLLFYVEQSIFSLISYIQQPIEQLCSNHKELFSLSVGTPTISLESETNTELIDIILPSLNDGFNKLFNNTTTDSEHHRILNKFNSISERFSLESISSLYFGLLCDLIDSHSVDKLTHSSGYTPHSISILADFIDIEEIIRLTKSISSRSIIVKFVHILKPSKFHLDFYISNSIIPYLLDSAKLDKSLQLFVEDLFIIFTASEESRSFVESVKSFLSIYQDSSTFSPSFVLFDDFDLSLLADYPLDIIEDTNLDIYCTSHPSFGLDYTDLLVIVPVQNKGWILDGIAKEIVSRHPSSSSIFYAPKSVVQLPPANNILFMHQSLVLKYFKAGLIHSNSCNISCWYTHSSGETSSVIADYILCFNSIHKVVFTCSLNQTRWINLGVSPQKTCVILGGFDKNLFSPHNRHSSQSIGICSSYYERKDPMLIFDVVRLLPQYHFLLVGRNWEKFSLFEYLKQLGNLSYTSPSYFDYPYFYSKMDVFFSPSILEGGPIPVLEAMASNCYPVVSRTGFCPDIINNGTNGYLFELGTSAKSVSNLLVDAKTHAHVNISSSVQNYCWDSFASSFQSLIFV